jgi:hypothetical protein
MVGVGDPPLLELPLPSDRYPPVAVNVVTDELEFDVEVIE